MDQATLFAELEDAIFRVVRPVYRLFRQRAAKGRVSPTLFARYILDGVHRAVAAEDEPAIERQQGTPSVFRPPTREEVVQLTAYVTRLGLNPGDAQLTAEAAHVGVIDDYMSSGPGHVGKVMLVIWDGGPERVSSFTFGDDGVVKAVAIETAA